MVRDGMGWFTRWGLSVSDEKDKMKIVAIGPFWLVGLVGQKMVIAICFFAQY